MPDRLNDAQQKALQRIAQGEQEGRTEEGWFDDQETHENTLRMLTYGAYIKRYLAGDRYVKLAPRGRRYLESLSAPAERVE